jgi:hypothetical protein
MADFLRQEEYRPALAFDRDAFVSGNNRNQPNAFMAGLGQGVDIVQALGGGAVSAIGSAIGADSVRDWGARVYKDNMQQVQDVRPDLATVPWREGGASWGPWVANMLGQQVPIMGSMMLGGALLPVSAPAGLAAAASTVPRALGGAGLRAGAGFAERRAALRAGQSLADDFVGAAAVGAPMGAGAMYGEAIERGDPSRGEAFAALAASPIYGMTEAVFPTLLKNTLKKGLTGGVASRVATAGLGGAAAEAMTEGVQTGMELAFRPDLSPGQKANQIIDAALTGGILGGMLGGASGLRKLRDANPAEVPNEQMQGFVDAGLGQTGDPAALAAEGPPPVRRPDPGELPNVPPRPKMGENVSMDIETRQPRPLGQVPAEELVANLQKFEEVASRPDAPADVMPVLEATRTEFFRRIEELPLSEQPPQMLAYQMQDMTRSLETAREAGQLDPQDEAVLRRNIDTVAQELSRRSQDPQLFGDLPTQMENESVATAELTATQKRAMELAGSTRRTKLIDSLANAQDDVDLYNRVAEAFSGRKTATASVQKMAQSLGIIDAEGKERDLQAELSALEAQREKAWEQAKRNPGMVKKAQKLQAETLELRKLADLQQQAAVRREEQITQASRDIVEPPAPVVQAAPAVAPVAEAPAPFNPIMAERMQSAQRQQEFEAAQQQVRDRGFSPAIAQRGVQVAQQATETPARFSVQELNTGDRVQDPARRKTMGVINTLPVEQQDKILAQFDNDPKALIEYVRRQPSQKAARRKLAEVAGIDPVVFDSAPVPPYMDGNASRQVVDRALQETNEVYEGTTIYASEDLGISVDQDSGYDQFTIVDADGNQYDLTTALELARAKPNGLAWYRRATDIIAGWKAEQARMEQTIGGPLGNTTGNVARTDSIKPETAALLSDWMDYIGLQGVKVWLVDPKDLYRQDAVERYNLQGKYRATWVQRRDIGSSEGFSAALNRGRGEWIISLNQDEMTEAGAVEVMAHELGHVIKSVAYWNASQDTRAQLIDDYHNYLYRAEGQGGATLIAASRAYETARATIQANSNPTEEYIKYLTSFDEWIADNIAKWATTDRQAISIVDRFFANLAAKFRLLVDIFRAKRKDQFLPANSVKVFLNEMRNGRIAIDPTAEVEAENRSNGVNFMTSGGLRPDRLNDASKRMSELASSVSSIAINKVEASDKLRRFELWITSLGHIVEKWGKKFIVNGVNALEQVYTTLEQRSADIARLSHLFSDNYQLWQKLTREDKPWAEKIVELMKLTELRIDPAKTWAEHTWLQDRPNRDALRKKVNEANAIYAELQTKKMADGTAYSKVYDDAKFNMEGQNYASMVIGLRNLITDDAALAKEFPAFAADPMDRHRASANVGTPKGSRDFWKNQLDSYVADVRDFLAMNEASLEGDLTKKSKEEITRRVMPLTRQMQTINQVLNAMNEVPYFHLARFGNHFVAFTLRETEDGDVDPRAQSALIKRLIAAGFEGVQITRESQRSNVYIRVENADQREELFKLALNMQKEGILMKGDKKYDVIRGERGSEALANLMPEHYKRFLEAVKASFEPPEGMPETEKKRLAATGAKVISAMQELYLDMLPDTSVNKVTVRREDVPGYAADMMRGMAFRMQVGTNALANMSSAAKMSSALSLMKARINEDRNNPNVNIGELQQVFTEVALRESERPMQVGRSFWDVVRAVNHAFFLGMSPSYVIINMTQLGVLLWPELAKTHGYVGAAKTIAKVTPLALKIMKATLAEGKSLGWNRAADAVINERVLARAGVGKTDAKFIMDVVSLGIIDIGSASRELGRAADGNMDSKTDLMLRYASSFGYYSETTTRLIAALAARDLDKRKPSKDGQLGYVKNIVNQSMLNYQNWNQSRALGKMGVAGPLTPVMAAFYTYTAQLLEKMYREVGAAFLGRAENEQQKKEARRFLLSHSTFVAGIAGTMGLPFASVAFSVAGNLVDLFGDDEDEPYDAKAAYRRMLAGIFGDGAAEAIARGLPRVAGFDISSRAGEADILPFSRLLTDRRSWEDASKDWAENTFGAPFSMMSNIIEGGRDFMKGDHLAGATKMAPMAFKGMLEAYSMTERGYVDKQGNALPLSPKGTDMAYQLIGFTPANKAEYNEARLTQIARRGEMTRMAGDLRRKIAVAIEKGDRDEAQELISRARRFDATNPAFAVLPSIPGTLQQRARARALAEATGTPLGVSPKDLRARELTSWANY